MRARVGQSGVEKRRRGRRGGRRGGWVGLGWVQLQARRAESVTVAVRVSSQQRWWLAVRRQWLPENRCRVGGFPEGGIGGFGRQCRWAGQRRQRL